jgi:hypothetical protein
MSADEAAQERERWSQRVKTFREEEHELIEACHMGHGTMYDQDDLADVVSALADECENRERNERAEMKRADEYRDAYRAAEAELERVTAALLELRGAAGEYHYGCECGGSGVITACPGSDTEGCCGACEVTACECCPDLLVALYQADVALTYDSARDALAGGARAAQEDK